jgi:hypothetical protein
MPLITRQGKGSKLTIQEMDGNLEYLQTNLSGSNTIIGNTDIKTTADSDAILEIFSTSSVTTEEGPGGSITTTTQTERIKSDLSAIINTSPQRVFPPITINSEFTSSFYHINTSSSSSGEFFGGTSNTIGIGYTFASSSYYNQSEFERPIAIINKFIGSQGTGRVGEGYSDTTTIIPIGQDNTFSITATTANPPIDPNSGGFIIGEEGSGSIVLRKYNNSREIQNPSETTLYIAGNQSGVNIYSTEEQALNIYGAPVNPMVIPTIYPTLFQVNQSGSISIPQTASAEPTWTGSDGEIVPATVSGSYYLYMWMNGAWRSGSFS